MTWYRVKGRARVKEIKGKKKKAKHRVLAEDDGEQHEEFRLGQLIQLQG